MRELTDSAIAMKDLPRSNTRIERANDQRDICARQIPPKVQINSLKPRQKPTTHVSRSTSNDNNSKIIIGHVRSGILEVRDEGERISLWTSRDGLLMLDLSHVVILKSSRHEMTQISMPKRDVAQALGRAQAFLAEAIVKLPGTGLTPILLAHLDLVADHAPLLDVTDNEAATHVAISLAMNLLSRLACSNIDKGVTDNTALFLAATRYIELHAGRPDLTPQQIARKVRCSRSHLYRVFSQHGQQVACMLREIRLRRAMTVLKEDENQSIGMVAFNHGYSDLSTFGKAFRRHFGVSPAEFRSGLLPI